jgi:hypothetical protein
VRGALGNQRPYRDPPGFCPAFFARPAADVGQDFILPPDFWPAFFALPRAFPPGVPRAMPRHAVE